MQNVGSQTNRQEAEDHIHLIGEVPLLAGLYLHIFFVFLQHFVTPCRSEYKRGMIDIVVFAGMN